MGAWWWRLTVACGTAGLLGPGAAADEPDPDDDRPAVLVTGASSGIGRATAEHLAAHGFFVYAGARKAADLEALSALDHVQGVRLDVTVQAEVDAAVETVRAGGRGLFGLINNAGVAVVAPLVEVTEEDLAFQMDVNVTGVWRVTKAFAPLLVESGGRVATTSSISGFTTWPFGGPYTMSKHAVEAFTDVLAAELEPFGVTVGAVEPGNYRSRIGESMHERLVESGYDPATSLYGERMAQLLAEPDDRERYQPPDDVAAAFLAFLTDEAPRRRSMVVPRVEEGELTLRAALRRVAQLDAGSNRPLGRDALVAMLDEELAAARAGR